MSPVSIPEISEKQMRSPACLSHVLLEVFNLDITGCSYQFCSASQRASSSANNKAEDGYYFKKEKEKEKKTFSPDIC